MTTHMWYMMTGREIFDLDITLCKVKVYILFLTGDNILVSTKHLHLSSSTEAKYQVAYSSY